MDDRRLSNIMNMIRFLKEETAIANSVGGGGVAGITGEPPVNLKKKKRPPILARGKMPGARKRWSGGEI
jgi:hypothetical protein